MGVVGGEKKRRKMKGWFSKGGERKSGRKIFPMEDTTKGDDGEGIMLAEKKILQIPTTIQNKKRKSQGGDQVSWGGGKKDSEGGAFQGGEKQKKVRGKKKIDISK